MKHTHIMLSVIFTFILAGLQSCSDGEVKYYRARVVETIKHDTISYTQGLFFHDGRMFETSGQHGESALMEINPQTGEVTRRSEFEEEYFVEGSVAVDNQIIVMTWRNKEIFRYGLDDFKRISKLRYPREGWGITYDGTNLYASDGSSHIYIMDKDFRLKKKISVSLKGKQLRWLNELEYIDGKIWANVYTTDSIVIINPKSGNVEAVIDCSDVYPLKSRRKEDDVLNGIAFNPLDKKIYITGKYWPYMYQIETEKK